MWELSDFARPYGVMAFEFQIPFHDLPTLLPCDRRCQRSGRKVLG
jgi:hypothetical protein